MEKMVLDYFEHLFRSQSTVQTSNFVEHIEPQVIDIMNCQLLAPFFDYEMKTTLFQMYPTMAPGPDGIPPLFFQKFGHVVGLDVTFAIKIFLTSDCLLRKINFSEGFFFRLQLRR
ncbi:hypothetical protein GBA52_004004 [Prunus armeniaca]|nr:hypothetical protein GBA52_004004 [Prunus armeniaca]